MKVIEPYTAVCLQTTPPVVLNNKELREAIRYVTSMFNWCTKTGAEPSLGVRGEEHRFAPVKLIATPEFGIFTFPGPKEKATDYILSNGLAVRIPGEETNMIAEKAKELNVFVAAMFYEYDPEWPERYFNTMFLVNPKGEIVVKHRKMYIPLFMSIDVSPHDFYNEYMERYGDSLDTFYPVGRTEIGNIGFCICTEGWFPENFRALAMNGAEIVLHPNFNEPFYSSPMNTYEILNRAAAINNMIYVVGCAVGDAKSARPDVPSLKHPFRPQFFCPGDAMIVDYEGVIIARTPYPGETACWGTIRINELRKRRTDPWNYIAMLRTEPLRKYVYNKSLYPPNLFPKHKWKEVPEVIKRAPLDTIKRLQEEGVFEEPDQE